MSDATGRNALYKIHVSLGKIVNGLAEKAPKGRKASTPVEDRTTLLDDEEGEGKPKMEDLEEENDNTIRPTPEADDMNETLRSSVETSLIEDEEESGGRIKVEVGEDEEEDTIILLKREPENSRLGRDSLVESLLSDDELEMSGT